MRKYFRMRDDVDAPGRWWLDLARDARGEEIIAGFLTVGQRVDVTAPLKIPLQYEGSPLDFTFAAFDIPVLNRRALHLLTEFAANEFQCFLANVEGQGHSYAVVNFLQVRKCLDESKSEFLKWTKNDHRADLAGQYRQVTKLRIDPKLVDDCDVFRLWGWEVALIVSERVQRAFIDHGISGIHFVDV